MALAVVDMADLDYMVHRAALWVGGSIPWGLLLRKHYCVHSILEVGWCGEKWQVVKR